MVDTQFIRNIHESCEFYKNKIKEGFIYDKECVAFFHGKNNDLDINTINKICNRTLEHYSHMGHEKSIYIGEFLNYVLYGINPDVHGPIEYVYDNRGFFKKIHGVIFETYFTKVPKEGCIRTKDILHSPLSVRVQVP